MTVPAVNLTMVDGALGIMPEMSGLKVAHIGVSTSGTVNTPVAFGRRSDVEAYFGAGPLVEAMCYTIQKTGKPCIGVRAAAATNTGSSKAIDVTHVTGTSVVSVDSSVKTIDEYDVVVYVVNGGTTGTAGITYKYSLDGGLSYSDTRALGTATTLTIYAKDGDTDTDVAKFDMTTGGSPAKTLVTGDYWTLRTIAPYPTAIEGQAALDALADTQLEWDIVHWLPNSPSLANDDYAMLEDFLSDLWDVGKHKMGICNAERPDLGDTENDYYTTLSAYDEESTFAAICAGYCSFRSAVSGRKYSRPASWAVVARLTEERITSPRVSIAELNLGPLTGVDIADAGGNPWHHDEYLNPLLDGLGFLCLRSWPKRNGTYVNIPRIKCSTGSDYDHLNIRWTLNRAADALRPALEQRLEKAIRVSSTTGYILKEEAVDIEAVANSALATAVLANPDASDAVFVLSRTDNVLATKTLTGECRITPLGRPTTISATIGMSNPAARTVVI